MKLIFSFILFLIFSYAHSQDTLILRKDYKYKIGAKLISETSDYHISLGRVNVFAAGIQFIRRMGASNSSIETGLYINTRGVNYEGSYENTLYPPPPFMFISPVTYRYHYLSVPINYRIDTKVIYMSTGIIIDQLLLHSKNRDVETGDIIGYGEDRKLLIGYNFNLGLEKPVTNEISVFVEGRFAATISSLKTDGGLILTSEVFDPSGYNWGFGIGFNYIWKHNQNIKHSKSAG